MQATDDSYQDPAHRARSGFRSSPRASASSGRRRRTGQGGGDRRHQPQAGEELDDALAEHGRDVRCAAVAPPPRFPLPLLALVPGAPGRRARRLRQRRRDRAAPDGAGHAREPRRRARRTDRRFRGAAPREARACPAASRRGRRGRGPTSRRLLPGPAGTRSPCSSSTPSADRPTAPETHRWPASARSCCWRWGRSSEAVRLRAEPLPRSTCTAACTCGSRPGWRGPRVCCGA